MWFILFCYPQALFLGLLPYNAGLDDLAVIILAARMLFYQVPGVRARWAAAAFALALAAMVMESLSSMTGAMYISWLLPITIKTILKGGVLAVLTLALALGIRDERDIRRHITAFALAACLAYVIVVICYFAPSFSDPWQVQASDWAYRAGTAEARTCASCLPGTITRASGWS